MKTLVVALTLGALAGPISQAGEPPAGRKALVGHWTMDGRPAERTVRDSSPNALHGSLRKPGASRWGPGRMGGSLGFPGEGPVDLAPHAGTLARLKDFTLSQWIQHTPGPSRILLSWSDGTHHHRVQVEVHGGRLHFGWQNGGGWQAFGTRPLRWKPGVWYHVVFVNDGAAGKAEDVYAVTLTRTRRRR